jgi:Tfp pilus assembly protein PilF
MREKIEKLSARLEVFGPIKDSTISILIVISTILLGISIFKSTITDSIEFEPLQIPAKFTDKGYTPQIATIRLIDEIRRINSFATTTKTRSSVAGSAPGEALAKIDNLPIPGSIDITAIQGIVRDLLGVQKKSISGEITLGGDDKSPIFIVRIRQSPENILLVDERLEGSPEDILPRAALKIVEKIDPVVAASYYRNKKMMPDALRMIDAALTNSNKADDTFALSQRAQIYKAQKNFELSKLDLDALLEIDPKSPQGLGVMSAWFIEQGKFEEGLMYADKQIEAKPDMWFGYFNKADALIGLQKNAETAYQDGLKHDPSKSYAYIEAANYFEKNGKSKEAVAILLKGAGKFPNQQDINLVYGKRLLIEGHRQLAGNYLKKAYLLNPANEDAREMIFKGVEKDDPVYLSALKSQSK